MTDEEHIEELKAMIAADKEHLAKQVAAGNRVVAHGHLDAIIDNSRQLETRLRHGR